MEENQEMATVLKEENVEIMIEVKEENQETEIKVENQGMKIEENEGRETELKDENQERTIEENQEMKTEKEKPEVGAYEAGEPDRCTLESSEWTKPCALSDLQICDTILEHANQRFAFTNHLVSATLLHADRFLEYHKQFPNAALNTIIEAYPLLNKNKLKTELALIYSNAGFRRCSGAVALYQFFMRNDLQDIFSETVALLKILITTPMTTAESERCFSTLKRIKTFLRNTMSQDHLNALAMVSMEKNLIKTIPDFNHRVIEKFASLNDRMATFMYKK
ncbi:uncharacterized protein LOC119794031 isoform X2 [Cyprinodon tularosa]|uniref:uncharacterized protein LOC119794031 isoform X2 n=1 Tax=Cyprinodon tularosa TaxID=77115 RepID=UPI0018E24E0A|nr:uncharacterized protein LOC119794031 isoform X2 [Cyprinodon tularosa]